MILLSLLLLPPGSGQLNLKLLLTCINALGVVEPVHFLQWTVDAVLLEQLLDRCTWRTSVGTGPQRRHLCGVEVHGMTLGMTEEQRRSTVCNV